MAEIRVLGPLEVTDGAGPLDIGGPKPRALIAVLAASAGEVVSTDVLVDALWGEDVPSSAVNSLQTYVSRLRKALGTEAIESRAPGYVLDATVDAMEFERLASAGHRTLTDDPAGAVAHLTAALELWRGRPFDGVDVPALSPVVTRLEEARLAAVEDRIEAELELGRHGALVGELEALVEEQPWRERLWGQLMTALYRAGRQAEALRAYQRASRILGDELGIDPSPELRELEDLILQQAPELTAPETQPVAELSPGRSVRGYELRDRLASTDEAIVFRAYQASLGREVAVKVYRPDVANDPRFIRDFDTAARALASLEHPNMARVYDFWREPDAAYLVTTWLPQGTLADRLASGPLPLDRAVGVVDQIASVLAAAHRRGITHGHIDSTNVLLDDEANASLVDFDLTAVAHSLHASQRADEEAAAQRDLAALGELARMLISPEAPTEPLPAAEQRFDEAVAVASAVRSALGMEAAEAVEAPEARNPYKGLQAFTESDAGDFFGRESMVSSLTGALAPGPRSRFLAVVGPSGSGKSSVVKAGLLPAVRGGAVGGSDRWYVVDMFPGSRPFAELEAALLRVAVNPPASLLDQLQSGVDGIGRAIKRVLPDPDSELLLVIDQFEELFTLADDEVTNAFLDGLVDALNDERSRLRVVVTLRADFYDRPLGHAGLAEWMRERTEVVVPLTTSELEEAISGPARGVGVTVEPGLVGEMIGAVADQPGALPLLQYALTELFDGRDGGPLRLEAYHEIGGVAGALARRADDLFTSLNRPGQHAAQQVFLRLFALGEGTEDTRRRARVTELTALSANRVASSEVLQCFGDFRLLSFDRDPVSRGATVEVAHEALLRSWGRLRGWVADARDDIRQQRQLSTDATAWADNDRDPSFLLTGTRLQVAAEWAAGTTLALSGTERRFLDASTAADEERRTVEREQAEREEQLERRAARRLRVMVGVFAVAALVGAGLTWFAFGERADAERERDRNAALVEAAETSEAEAQRQATLARIRSLAASAENLGENDPQLATLLALEAAGLADTLGGPLPREVIEALHTVVAAPRPVIELAEGTDLGSVAISSDGEYIATGRRRSDPSVQIWDGATGEAAFTISEGHGIGITRLDFVTDTHTLVVFDRFSNIHIWDLDTLERVQVPAPGEGYGRYFAFSADGATLYATSSSRPIQLQAIDMATGAPERIIMQGQPFGGVNGAASSPTGTRLVLAPQFDDTTFVLIDPRTTEEVAAFTSFSEPVWSPLGRWFVHVGPDGLQLRDGASGDLVRTLGDAPDPDFGPLGEAPARIRFSDAGRLLAVGGQRGDVVVWEVSTGAVLFQVDAHDQPVVALDFDGRGQLVTMSSDGLTRIWDIDRFAGEIDIMRIDYEVSEARFSDGARRIVTASVDETLSVATLRSTVIDGPGEPWSASLEPGRFDFDVNEALGVVVAPGDPIERFQPIFYDSETGETVAVVDIPDFANTIAHTHLSKTGKLYVGSGDRTSPFIVAIADNSVVLEISPGFADREGDAVAFTSDDRIVALTAIDGKLRRYDLLTGEELAIEGQQPQVRAAAIGPRDELLASAHSDGTVRLVDVQTGALRGVLRGHFGPVTDVVITAGGDRVVSAGADGTVRVWDVATATELIEIQAHESEINSLDLHPNGDWVLTGGQDGTVRILTLDVDELLEIARSRAPDRGFTAEECARYGIECP